MVLFKVLGESPDSPGDENVISGTGIFGVGGAIGPGKAAKGGYDLPFVPTSDPPVGKQMNRCSI